MIKLGSWFSLNLFDFEAMVLICVSVFRTRMGKDFFFLFFVLYNKKKLKN